jgi:hypothetical protein
MAAMQISGIVVTLSIAIVGGTVTGRVRPFRLKNFFAYKRNKAKLDPVHMCFACSL